MYHKDENKLDSDAPTIICIILILLLILLSTIHS